MINSVNLISARNSQNIFYSGTRKENNVNSVSYRNMADTVPKKTPVSSILKERYLNHFGKKLSFLGIRVLSIAEDFRPQEKKLVEEAEDFVKKGNNVEFLGKGKFSKAYEFLRMPFIVIKKSLTRNETYYKEASALQSVPEEIKRKSQGFVARMYDDEADAYYILSTKVGGKIPHPDSAPITQTHLRSFFDSLFVMDKAGFYHGDLNNGNIKVQDDGVVNFLDYQWNSNVSKNCAFERKPEQLFPPFIYLQNSQMYEMAGLPTYIKNVRDPAKSKEFFRSYLQTKSSYHAKRADYIRELAPNWPYSSEVPDVNKAIIYEDAQAKVFKNPTEEVLKTEAQKVQFLSAFREAYKHIDPNLKDQENIIPAGSAYLYALSRVQNFRKTVADMRKGAAPNSDMARYLEGHSEYGNYWYENLKEWTANAFGFPYRHTSGNARYDETSHNFNYPNIKLDKFESLTDITGMIDKSYSTSDAQNVDVRGDAAITAKIKEVYQAFLESTRFGSSIPEIGKKREEVMNAFYMVAHSHQKGYFMDLINSSLYATLRARELLQEVNKAKASGSQNKTLENHKKLAATFQDSFSFIANSTFQKVYNRMICGDANSITPVGYGNMNNFTINLTSEDIATVKSFIS